MWAFNVFSRTVFPHAKLSAKLVTLMAALGIILGSTMTACAHTVGSYEVAIQCESSSCPELSHRGTRWVMAEFGERYSLRIWNHSGQWVEAVVSVDGRDVLNGARTSDRNRGYLIAPYDSVQVDGWRTSDTHVAAFRFTSVADSYAGRVDGGGQAGRIDVKFFPGTMHEPPVSYVPDAPPPPPWWGWRDGEGRGSERDEAAAGSSSEPLANAEARPEAARKSADDGYGGSTRPRYSQSPRPRQDLGTQYGESQWSEVVHVDFRRDRPSWPSRTIHLRYDSRAGLVSKGVIDPSPPVWQPRPRPVPYAEHHGYVPPPPGY